MILLRVLCWTLTLLIQIRFPVNKSVAQVKLFQLGLSLSECGIEGGHRGSKKSKTGRYGMLNYMWHTKLY